MKNFYISPIDGSPLTYNEKDASYTSKDGIRFETIEGIPDFTYPKILDASDAHAKQFYEGRSDSYDKYLHLTFQTYFEDETKVRNSMIDLLNLKPGAKVLEIAAGTGRDSEIIAKRLGKDGELHLQDISGGMLKRAREKLIGSDANVAYSVGNACYLPYPDNYFDAIYQFGGVGEFSDISRFFKECVRVAKPGAKVVAGDENLPVWQRKSLFGKILSNYNPQFLAPVPFEYLPIEARKVKVQWIIGGVFYLFDFEVGTGDLPANFDFEIPGPRGGTHKSRYYGQLEAVTPETKELAWKAVSKTGKSMHQWLDELVKQEAKKLLDNK
jgi:ubiquinone/menaquinone biosynthesis C-methylase UbiE